MSVGMIEQGASPGMEHGQNAQLTADKLGVPSQLLQRGGRAGEEQAIDGLLMGVSQRPQRLRQCEGQQVMGAGKQLFLVLGQPTFGLLTMAFGTMAVAARVIAVLRVTALVTFIEMTAAGRRAAADQIPQSLMLARQEAMVRSIGWSVAAENVRHLNHGRLTARS